MEPNVVRMFSSSPPPLDEAGEEEDEDEFGDFGGYCGGMLSSCSFSENDAPAAETLPPDLHATFVPEAAKNRQNVELEMPELLSNGVLHSDRQRAHSVPSNPGHHGPATAYVIQDPESSNPGQHRDVHNTGRGRDYLNNGPQEGTTGTRLKSTETNLSPEAGTEAGDHTTETELTATSEPEAGCRGSGTGLAPNAGPEAGNLSKKMGLELRSESSVRPLSPADVSETELSPSSSEEDQSNPGKKEGQGEDEEAVSGQAGEEAVGSCPKEGSGGCGDHTDVSGSVKEVEVNPEAQVSEIFEDCNEVPVDPTAEMPTVCPDTELEEGTGTALGSTMEAVKDVDVDTSSREVRGNSADPPLEDFGDFGDAAQGFADFSWAESTTQEGFADFVTALSSCSTDDEFGDPDTPKDLTEEADQAEEEEKGDGGDGSDRGTGCSELPPSNSFADFTSAPLGGLAGVEDQSWAAFGSERDWEDRQESWAAFGEEQHSSTTTAPPSDSLRPDNVSAQLNCKLQPLFQSTFPPEVTAEVTEVATLQAMLEAQDHVENSSLPAQGEAAAMWRHLLDIHSGHGLKFQWGGSRSNRILLDCLGIHNILFTGQKKQPVIVPMFAAGLGMLEPTKDPLTPPPTSPELLTPSSPGLSGPSLHPHQVATSWRAGEDETVPAGGTVSQLNLDFFGSVEECSSDSDTDAPMPGVDPELYELTTAKLESAKSNSNATEAFNKLMETLEKTSTVARKPQINAEISEEAARVISVLPDLSFMRARVLMFPSTLTPNHL